MQLRAEGARHDVLAAVFAAKGEQGADDDLTRLLARTDAVAALLGSPDGANLLTAYRRTANIHIFNETNFCVLLAPKHPVVGA